MKRKLSVFELVWYIVCGAIAVAGLVFLVLGLVGQFAGSDAAELRGFITPGFICIPSAAFLAVVVLLIFAKQSDRASEVAARRAARLGQTNQE